MPPRFTYWTILIDGQATAFRAHTREALLPTLVQLQRTNPGAEMKWFARGRIWDSPEAAAEALGKQRTKPRESRGPGWRPGGAHKDPRERFKKSRDERRKQWARRMRSTGGTKKT
jgi:hypothetical protein